MNRAVRRARLFEQRGDYAAFMEVLERTLERLPIDLYSFCVMPNHFHLVCAPRSDGELSGFMRLLTLTHSKRWHAARGTTGTGCVYQGRFRAFPIQTGEHFLTVCRYVERNALRARLVTKPELWPWSSLHPHWRKSNKGLLTDWPISKPTDWLSYVNAPELSLVNLRTAVRRNRPFGDPELVEAAAERHGLRSSLGGLGRPWR